MDDDLTKRSAVPRATRVLMGRFDVSQLVAAQLLMTIAGRSSVPVEALARRVVATSQRAQASVRPGITLAVASIEPPFPRREFLRRRR
jgi:hypothetical protein